MSMQEKRTGDIFKELVGHKHLDFVQRNKKKPNEYAVNYALFFRCVEASVATVHSL